MTAHEYWPSVMHMGDCQICGHLQDLSIHNKKRVMKLVVVESPFAGNVIENVRYARDCMRDCLTRDEAPFASHLLYPQILDDNVPAERRLGITCGDAWREHAGMIVFYTDRGWSKGMLAAWDYVCANHLPFDIRSLGGTAVFPSQIKVALVSESDDLVGLA